MGTSNRPVHTSAKTGGRRNRLFVALLIGFIVIIALSVVDRPVMFERHEHARKAAAIADIHMLKSAIGQYVRDVGTYPTTAEGLTALLSPPTGVEGWKGPYLSKLPKDPWGSPYVYRQVVRDGTPDFELRTFAGGATERSADDLAHSD